VVLGSSDDQLMRKIARGDEKAFANLFDRHSSKVLGYAKRLMGDSTRAEDVSQEVWMKVVKASAQYDGKDQFIAWLYTLIRNTAFNHLRRSKNTREDMKEDLESSVPAECTKQSIEETLIQGSDIELVKEKIQSLPDSQRTVLVAWMTEDLSYEDLAAQTGYSVSAVKSLLFRAKKNLEVALKGHV
jgi:RNA polymerase sigma-70 factor, ECF subfamily